MAAVIGTRLGPYEILSPLGAGGMGEVYRATDTRLGRTVALKVLPEDFLEGKEGGERRERFEREAKLLASLNHPNVATLYSFEEILGPSGSRLPVLAMELLEGETLRGKLGAPLSPKKAVEYAVQIACGLSAAHENGIVHRDLKPENLFVTKDGRIKILDFGLAKQVEPAIVSSPLTEAPTAAPATEAGVVLGTVGYMSPEQVMGKSLDARTDLFSLGVVLYEMLAGRRPFQRQTAPETLAAILRDEPPELSVTNKPIPAGLERIVRHCLEKDPGNRFQSAQDVAFALESLSQATSAGTAPLRSTSRRRRLASGALAVALLVASGAGLLLWGKGAGRVPWPTFKRLTFKRGTVASARFTPDYQSVVYLAAWEGKPSELFVQRIASADARPLGVRGAVAGTAGGDVAIVRGGTLSQLPLEGGTPRDLLKDVGDASWDQGGRKFVVVRAAGARRRLEFPAGKVLLETTGLEGLVCPRVSPDGRTVAFILRLSHGTDFAGEICVVDLSGQKRTLSKGWTEVSALAWSPDGREIWFSATRAGFSEALHAVTLSGRERLVARLPGSVILRDIAPDGRVLLTYGQSRRHELRGRMAGDAAERDLSWLDGTCTPRIAPDGTQMLVQEWGEGGFRAEDPRGGVDSSTYHWRSDGSVPKRLGPGTPVAVSPDWTTALVLTGGGASKELKLVPIGPGETTTLTRGPIRNYVWGYWHPDGKRIVVKGTDAEGQMRLFVQDVSGGQPRPFGQSVELENDPFSPDGRYIATRQEEGKPYVLCAVDGGETRPIPFLNADDVPLVFGDGGTSVFIAASDRFPLRVQRIDLEKGKREPWLELVPPDRAGLGSVLTVDVTPNGRFYAYSYRRTLSDLYLVEGLR